MPTTMTLISEDLIILMKMQRIPMIIKTINKILISKNSKEKKLNK
jgi:hypothetical protein